MAFSRISLIWAGSDSSVRGLGEGGEVVHYLVKAVHFRRHHLVEFLPEFRVVEPFLHHLDVELDGGERVLYFVGYAGGHGADDGKLVGLYQLVPGILQFLELFHQVAVHDGVLHGDRGLIGKGGEELDIFAAVHVAGFFLAEAEDGDKLVPHVFAPGYAGDADLGMKPLHFFLDGGKSFSVVRKGEFVVQRVNDLFFCKQGFGVEEVFKELMAVGECQSRRFLLFDSAAFTIYLWLGSSRTRVDPSTRSIFLQTILVVSFTRRSISVRRFITSLESLRVF